MNWQPIETAPKNQNILLLKIDGSRKFMYIGRYITEFTEEQDLESDFCEYDELTDTFYVPEGWVEKLCYWPEYSSLEVEETPNYWMPLPEFPEDLT